MGSTYVSPCRTGVIRKNVKRRFRGIIWMITNYDSRNSLEYYDLCSVYAFPVLSSFSGIPLSENEKSIYKNNLTLLDEYSIPANTGFSSTENVRTPGVVVDKERDGNQSRLVVIIRANVNGKTEYQYKKYAVGLSGGSWLDGATMPVVPVFTFSPLANTPRLSALSGNIPPVLQNNIHTGPVEKTSANDKHTGPIEKLGVSEKHTGPVEKNSAVSKHTGPVEKM